MEKSDYLLNVLETHKMKKIENLLSKYKDKREEIKNEIESEYQNKIYSPFNSGSYAKHTAINCKFDLDIVVPFKKDSFNTLKEMFDNLYDFLIDKYGNDAIVRKQKVSIGITFDSDEDGDEIDIDVVPGRELTKDDYPDSRGLNLFFNERMGLFSSNSYIKTNINSQIKHINKRENERKIIRLLKIWKYTNNENLKSFLIELITIKAFDNVNVSGNIWEQLKSVMEYIKDNIRTENFTLNDPGNSNNNVADTLDESDKEYFAERMINILNRVEDDSENLKFYFPLNKDFEEDEVENKYNVKQSSYKNSVPPTNQRFGRGIE
ncbi:SMODS domain-containing nucleotidyltransferase [Mesonia mobilis]|uniref:Nucleotidyltransferase n=1 Tax=Mesonia mobilis TaxID=369791 RepID=A0ABQ3BSS8_9FLAO|nr:hypothetical protein [Mesonia mobilis]MBQ0738540.1 nucleotidyltransferase [Aquimarina celericrescens]GGZ56488.1 hypothetical protein GCM10008088_17580 [Mesonia mobilis]